MPQPTHIGKYEILDEIGRGGFATVYKALDPALDRVVALKVLHPYWTQDATFEARFHREARAAANLRHPNIVTVHDAGEADGDLYIAMEYLPGPTLHQLLEEGALTVEQTLPILEQLAAALDYAHSRGVVHRDVKPNNVIISPSPPLAGEPAPKPVLSLSKDLAKGTEGGQSATLMDFGLVKALTGSSVLTSQGTLLGSPEYMAPEQADPERVDEIGPAADRYALGVVAYHMLAGRVPFPGNTPATLNAHLNLAPPAPRSLNPGLPAEVEQALLKALAKKPDDRYPTARAFAAALRQAVEADARAHQRQEQLAALYEKLRQAVQNQDWPAALTLGGQIQALEPGYRDAPDLVAQAREQLRRPPSRRVPIPTWGWSAGAALLVLLVLLCVAATMGPQLWKSIQANIAPNTPTYTPTSLPPPANTPTYTPITSHTPTTTPTPMPTATRPPTVEPTLAAAATRTRPADGMTMVYVPGGAFQMGSAEGDADAHSDEFPQHPVALDAFWIDRTEVTNAQYALCVTDGECNESSLAGDSNYNGDDYPVVGVSWEDAMDYCTWVGAQLPTEAQWEYAARGEQGYIYSWGNDFDCSRGNFDDETEINEYVVQGGEGCDGYVITAPVGSFLTGASWCDALDMAGNVWEWVADWYGDYPSGAQTNPTGPTGGNYKVLRGGSFNYGEAYFRASSRDYYAPTNRFYDIGFRCVGVAPGR